MKMDKDNSYYVPLSDVSVARDSLNCYDKIKLWLVIGFLLVNAAYIFLIAFYGNKYLFSLWGLLSVVIIIGLILSKPWSLQLYLLAALQGIFWPLFIMYILVSNSMSNPDITLIVSKVIGALIWIVLWVIVGIYFWKRFGDQIDL